MVPRTRPTLAALAGATLLALVLAAPSGAATTIGADLTTPATETSSCSTPGGGPFGCTRFNSVVPGRTITSPIDGVVVRWRIHPEDGSEPQNVRLRIIRPAGGGTYESGGASAAQPISTTTALQVFPTRLPIRTGDHIGLDQGNGSSLDASIRRVVPGATYPNFSPPLADSGAFTPFAGPSDNDDELVLNADIEADADSDGFGDETQDQCPTDASTQGPCPPATPQCSDGVDNDGDGAVDGKDPGCLSGETGSNPADNNEGDESVRDLVLCGQREISLARADVRGRKVVLSGIVSARMTGRSVTILANYGTAKGSALRKVATVRPNSAGVFTARVAKPPARLFNKARFQAQVDSFRSVQLKLPQSLASSSVKLQGGQIVLRGKVKPSLLGKRNPVVVRRLVCSSYQTVGSARPDRAGNYVVRFDAPSQATTAGLYRAESRVLARPGSKRYVRQYARAIGITLPGPTG